MQVRGLIEFNDVDGITAIAALSPPHLFQQQPESRANSAISNSSSTATSSVAGSYYGALEPLSDLEAAREPEEQPHGKGARCRTLVFSAYSLADKRWWLRALRDAAAAAASSAVAVLEEEGEGGYGRASSGASAAFSHLSFERRPGWGLAE